VLIVAPPFQQPFAQLGLTSPDRFAKLFLGETNPTRTTVVVKPGLFSLPGWEAIAVYYKQYEYVPPAWKFVGRRSKARCEFQNYNVFARLGVPAAEPMACGEQRDALGRLRRAFILTRAIPDALTLKDFFQQRCADRAAGNVCELRAGLLRKLADLTRLIHTNNFFHDDLVWRNLLVTWSPPAPPKLWWIDCPRGRFDRWSPWRGRHRLNDLGSLDKVAAQLCRPGERVAFVKRYLGKTRLDAEAKRLMRAVLAYRKRRWPEDGK
jgi:hypothetical protein